MRCRFCGKRSKNYNDFDHVWKFDDVPSTVPGRLGSTMGVIGGKQICVCPGCHDKLPFGTKPVAKPKGDVVPTWVRRKLSKKEPDVVLALTEPTGATAEEAPKRSKAKRSDAAKALLESKDKPVAKPKAKKKGKTTKTTKKAKKPSRKVD